MNSIFLNLEKISGWHICLFFIFIYLILYPQAFLIIDEVCYFEQACAYSKGQTQVDSFFDLSYCYPVGMPFFIAFWVLLFGPKAGFLVGVVSLTGSFILISQLLKKINLPDIYALFLFIYPPAIFLSRTMMSDVPSLLIASLFYWIFFTKTHSIFNTAILSLIAGCSVLFREPNILLFIPFLLGIGIRENKKIPLLLVGFSVGFLLRLLSAKIFFDDFFFIKPNGWDFSFGYLIYNLPYYTFILLVFVPFGLWTVIRYNSRYKYEIISTVGIFLFFYSVYGYTGANSGIKSIILGPRFFIPILPLFCITGAYFFENLKTQKIKTYFKRTLSVSAIMAILSVNLLGHIYNNNQISFTEEIYKNKNAIYISLYGDQIPKYTNSLYGSLAFIKPKSLSNEMLKEKQVYAISILSRKTDTQENSVSEFKRMLKNLGHYDLALVRTYKNVDGTCIYLWEVK